MLINVLCIRKIWAVIDPTSLWHKQKNMMGSICDNFLNIPKTKKKERGMNRTSKSFTANSVRGVNKLMRKTSSYEYSNEHDGEGKVIDETIKKIITSKSFSNI